MVEISWQAPAILSLVLFLMGLVCLLTRRNLIFVLMAIEIMLIMVLNLAGAELALGLILVLRLRGRLPGLDGDSANMLKDRAP